MSELPSKVTCTVLVVEDNPGDAALVEDYLTELDAKYVYHIHHVTTLAGALAALIDPIPDVILLDLTLPDTSGLDGLRRLREEARNIPVVVVTGHNDEETAFNAIQAGAQDYLIKDEITPSLLRRALRYALERHRLLDQLGESLRSILESQRQMSIFMANLPGFAYRCRSNDRWTMLFVSDGCHALTGYTAAELTGNKQTAYANLIVASYREQVQTQMAAALEARQPFRLTYPIQMKDGREHWVWEKGTGVWDTDGSLLYLEGVILDIDEQIRAQQALAKTQRSLLHAQHIAMLGSWEWYLDTSTFKWSDEMYAIYGVDKATFVPRLENVARLTHPDDAAKTERLIDKTLANTEGVLEYQVRIVRPNGEVRHVHVRAEIAYDENSSPTSIFGITMDITERKQAEANFHREQSLLRMIFNSVPDSLYVKDTEGRFLMGNPAVARLMGTNDPGDLVGKTDYSFFSEAQADFYATGERGVLENDEPLLNRQEYIFDPTGKRRWMLTSKYPLHSDNDEIIGLLGVGRDVTELQEALASEREQRALANALRDITVTLTETLDLDAVMNRVLANVGEVVPHDAADIMLIEGDKAHIEYTRNYPPSITNQVKRLQFDLKTTLNFQQMLASGEPLLISDTQQYPGWITVLESRWIRSYVGVPIRAYDNIIGFLNLSSREAHFFTPNHAERLKAFAAVAAIAINNARLYNELEQHAEQLAERVAARTAELEASRANYRAIVDDQMEIVMRYKPDGTITFANSAASDFAGKPPEKLLGTNMLDIVHPDDRAAVKRYVHRLSPENATGIMENRNIDHEDNVRWYAWTDKVVRVDDDDIVQEIQAVGRDITQHKRMEDQLRQALEREMQISTMRSRFLSMAAHDMRNPLTIIQSSAELLLQYGDRLTEERRETKWHNIQAAIGRMVELLDDVLMVGRIDAGKLRFDPAPLHVKSFCESLVEEMSHLDEYNEIIFEVVEPCGRAMLDQKLLYHILGNLLSNAIKYSPDNTPIWFKVRSYETAIEFTVQDQGIGIPQKEQEHIFEYFHRFSNVGTLPGTGLGLAIVKQSVELHGGEITFESAEGLGTTFTVCLPYHPVKS